MLHNLGGLNVFTYSNDGILHWSMLLPLAPRGQKGKMYQYPYTQLSVDNNKQRDVIKKFGMGVLKNLTLISCACMDKSKS